VAATCGCPGAGAKFAIHDRRHGSAEQFARLVDADRHHFSHGAWGNGHGKSNVVGLVFRGHSGDRHRLRGAADRFLGPRHVRRTLTNAALREANIDARIDHRTLAAQGIDREPLPHIPLAQLKMERRGVPSLVAQRLRAEYRERVQGREERSANRTAAKNHEGPTQATASAAGVPGQPADMEEIRRQAREAWLRLRSKEADKAGGRGGERETLQGEAQPKDELAR
jgi:hypothetical protein